MANIESRPKLYPEERDLILDRDKRECQRCGSKLFLEIHHIDHDKTNQSFLNLITLCKDCHVEASSIYHKIEIERVCRERINSTYLYILKDYLNLTSTNKEVCSIKETLEESTDFLDLFEVRIGEDLFKIPSKDYLTARWKAARLFRDKYRLDINLEYIVEIAKARVPSKPLPILKTTKEVLESLILKLK